MNCDAFRAAYLAGDHDDRHLQVCPQCRQRLGEMDALRERLGDPLLWEAPPEGLAERVVGAIGDTSGTRSGTRRWQGWVAVAAAVAVVGGWMLRPEAPDWSVTLAAAGSGLATVDGWNTETGTRMELEVTGIPHLEGDAFYEIWLTSPDGRSVSAGTFGGPGIVSTWVAVRRADHPRIWITREANDGDPSPSWDVIFDT